MTRQRTPSISDEDGWLITPRALTSLATAVGLVYTLHAPVRYVMRMGASVDALTARVASLETELDNQRGTMAAAELVILDHEKRPVPSESDTILGTSAAQSRSHQGGAREKR